MNATENVSQDTMPWSISSTKAVRVKDSMSPKLENTGRHNGHGPGAKHEETPRRDKAPLLSMATNREDEE